jgi:hypothetical protein
MSTNSRIGKLLPDGRVRAITCHWDGYVEGGVGEDLLNHYSDSSKVDSLLDLGNLSALGKEIGEKQDFNDFTSQNQNWCLAYGRDRGESNMESKIVTLEEFQTNLNWPYLYLFKEGEWNFSHIYGDVHKIGWRTISSVLKNINDEDED